MVAIAGGGWIVTGAGLGVVGDCNGFPEAGRSVGFGSSVAVGRGVLVNTAVLLGAVGSAGGVDAGVVESAESPQANNATTRQATTIAQERLIDQTCQPTAQSLAVGQIPQTGLTCVN